MIKVKANTAEGVLDLKELVKLSTDGAPGLCHALLINLPDLTGNGVKRSSVKEFADNAGVSSRE